jgi:hypothetical protein
VKIRNPASIGADIVTVDSSGVIFVGQSKMATETKPLSIFVSDQIQMLDWPWIDVQIAPRKPPEMARYVLHLLLSRRDRQNLIGDLIEEFQTVQLPEFGVRKANFWFWEQAISSVWPIIRGRIRNIVAIGGIVKAAHEIYKRLEL